MHINANKTCTFDTKSTKSGADCDAAKAKGFFIVGLFARRRRQTPCHFVTFP